MTNKIDTTTEHESIVNQERRAFIDKAGKYAIVGTGMATLMTPSVSSAGNYGKKCGGCSAKRPRRKRHNSWWNRKRRKGH